MKCTKNDLWLLSRAQYDLFEPLHYGGQVSVRPEVPRLVSGLAHRTDALTRKKLFEMAIHIRGDSI